MCNGEVHLFTIQSAYIVLEVRAEQPSVIALVIHFPLVFKVILYSYLILKKMNERVIDS